MDDGLPARPYLTLLVSLEQEQILNLEFSHDAPDIEALTSLLWQTMLKPDRELRQPPHRPQTILCDQEALVGPLSAPLSEIGVEVQYEAASELLDQIAAMVEDEFGEDSDRPGLLSIPDSSPELLGRLFEAAAEAYRQEPWIYLSTEQPVKFAMPALQKYGYAQLMGNSAIEYGLLLYWNWEDLERSYLNTGDPRPTLPKTGWTSFSYATADLMSPDDLEAIKTYHWPVADAEAYPLPLVIFEDHVERPDAATLQVITSLLRTLPEFVQRLELDFQGDYLPLTMELPTVPDDEALHISLQYPAGQLRREAFPAMLQLGDEELDFEDEDEVFGEESEQSEFENLSDSEDENLADWKDSPMAQRNPSLVKAMGLVYEAWDELNPSRGIQLVRQALEISPDCAEAYVFLAEELAVNVGQALKFYQKGIEAGERSLGPAFFDEYAGTFWEHVEARPYLRARAGLSRTIWELGRRAETLDHCQELLRLDADDNLSCRYAILLIFLEMGRWDEAYHFAANREDVTETWLYTTALLEFQQNGDSSEAQNKLRQAIQANPHTPDYLTGRKRLPVDMPEVVRPGRKSGALEYVATFAPYWRQTAGAIDWLRKHAKAQGRTTASQRTSQGPKGKRTK